MPRRFQGSRPSRRSFLKGSAALGTALAGGTLFAPAVHAAKSIKLGYVSPQTGPLAAFAEADEFVITSFLETVKDGLEIGGETYAVEVVVKDSQSDPNRAAEVAKELIVDDKIDLMLVASTPETTNPVVDPVRDRGGAVHLDGGAVAALVHRPPGQPGDPASWKPFNYTYHFFWGLEDVIAVFTNMWGQLETNKTVGGLFPNDGDGNAWGDTKVGFPPVLDKHGYKLDRSRPLPEPHRRFLGADRRLQERQGARSSPASCCRPTSPPSGTRRTSRASSRRRRRSARRSCSRSRSRRSAKTGNNLSSEVWWSPSHPFKSSLTGMSASELAAAYQHGDRQAVDAADRLHPCAVRGRGRRAEAQPSRSATPTRRSQAIAATKLDTIVGHIAWDGANLPPFAAKNIAKTPLVGGQWRLKEGDKYDIVIVDNKTAPDDSRRRQDGADQPDRRE